MGSSAEPTKTTTVSASPYDIEKAKTADLMNNFLMSNIKSGMQGTPTSLDDPSTQNILNQLRQNAGRYNISPGTGQFQQIQSNMGEALTMPKGDMMSLAMSLYGQSQPAGQPGNIAATTEDPWGGVPGILRGMLY